MNRKMREILAKIQEKTNEAKNMEDVEKASAVSSGFGIDGRLRILFVISITCFFSALPYPVTDCFT